MSKKLESMITLRIDLDVKKALEIICEAKRISVSECVRDLILKYVSENMSLIDPTYLRIKIQEEVARRTNKEVVIV